MTTIINEIKLAVKGSYPDAPDNEKIENWRVRLQAKGVSSQVLEVLLNFFMSQIDNEGQPALADTAEGYVQNAATDINIDRLMERLDELEKENRALRAELDRIHRGKNKKWNLF